MKFTYADVNECCNEMTNITTRIHDIIDNIRTSAASLQNGIWTGSAAENYCSKIQDLVSSYESINNQITTYIRAINKCMENYQAIDNLVIGGGGNTALNVKPTKDVVLKAYGI